MATIIEGKDGAYLNPFGFIPSEHYFNGQSSYEQWEYAIRAAYDFVEGESMSNRLHKLHKKATGVGSPDAAHDRTVSITAAEWNALVDNIESLEKRIEDQRKEFALFLKQMQRR